MPTNPYEPPKEVTESQMRDVVNGKAVPCPVCGKPLALKKPGSGHHPGIYCETGCTRILIEMERRT